MRLALQHVKILSQKDIGIASQLNDDCLLMGRVCVVTLTQEGLEQSRSVSNVFFGGDPAMEGN